MYHRLAGNNAGGIDCAGAVPERGEMMILSCFPGIDLLGRAFEQEWPEACIVRGPDVLWGGDIKRFHAPAGVFGGIIGGPPCQSFTPMASINRALGRQEKYGNLIPEFERVVGEAQPDWFLMENVERAPLPSIDGYQVHAIILDNRWLGEEQSRRRRFCFGTRDGRRLIIDDLVLFENPIHEAAVTSSNGYFLQSGRGCMATAATAERRKADSKRPVEKLAELQGLPPDFLRFAPFTNEGKKKAIANGVPLPMGRAVARAVKRAMEAAS